MNAESAAHPRRSRPSEAETRRLNRTTGIVVPPFALCRARLQLIKTADLRTAGDLRKTIRPHSYRSLNSSSGRFVLGFSVPRRPGTPGHWDGGAHGDGIEADDLP